MIQRIQTITPSQLGQGKFAVFSQATQSGTQYLPPQRFGRDPRRASRSASRVIIHVFTVSSRCPAPAGFLPRADGTRTAATDVTLFSRWPSRPAVFQGCAKQLGPLLRGEVFG